MTASPLVLRDADFGYGEQRVVSGVTLEVQKGDVVAILGPNGSGKSTIIRGILGLADHLGGDVELLGTPLHRLRSRAAIGYVPQHHSLSSSVAATVREVVASGRLARRRWWQPETARDREIVEQALEVVRLSHRADEEVSHLSGGQQRRVLIARALVARPEVLVMDEPTAGVDRASQDVLARVLRRLAAEGTTMLIVTHELSALRGIVDRIVEVDSSHVTFDGSPERYADHQAELARRSGREVLG